MLVIRAHEAGEDEFGLYCSMSEKECKVCAMVHPLMYRVTMSDSVSADMQVWSYHSCQKAKTVCTLLQEKHSLDRLLAQSSLRRPEETTRSMREAVKEAQIFNAAMKRPEFILFKDVLSEFADREQHYKSLIQQAAAPYSVEFPSYWLFDLPF